MNMRILQHNPLLGNCPGNAAQLKALAAPGLNLCPSLALLGQPASSFLHVQGTLERCHHAARQLAEELDKDTWLVLSLPGHDEAGEPAPGLWLAAQGQLKPLAPDNVITGQAESVTVLDTGCVEPWDLALPYTESDAVALLASLPFQRHLEAAREDAFAALAAALGKKLYVANACGATDGHIQAGCSRIFSPEGTLLARAPGFSAQALEEGHCSPMEQGMEAVFQALVTGIRDYVTKCGFSGVVLGLSGGMDSALVAALAAEALGPENVFGLIMPSAYSSGHSREDARLQAANIGMACQEVSIEPARQAFSAMFGEMLKDFPAKPGDLVEENIQPRIRGNLLMAMAQRLGRLVLATGNKSEAAMGYCTLYGDTTGALAPIGDFYKTEVYELARWYNQYKQADIIPERVFTKAPSAELKPGQTDQDSLPPYEVLDAVLADLLEGGKTLERISLPGVDSALVAKIAQGLAMAEFKRHQSPPALCLGARPLGRTIPAAAWMW